MIVKLASHSLTPTQNPTQSLRLSSRPFHVKMGRAFLYEKGHVHVKCTPISFFSHYRARVLAPFRSVSCYVIAAMLEDDNKSSSLASIVSSSNMAATSLLLDPLGIGCKPTIRTEK